MDTFLNILTDYYYIFIIIFVFFLISLIGYIVEGKKNNDDIKNASLEQIIDNTEVFNQIPDEQQISEIK